MFADQPGEIVVQPFLVFAQLIDGKLADDGQQAFAEDEDTRIDKQACQILSADQLINNQRGNEDGNEGHQDITKGFQGLQGEEQRKPLRGHREHEADDFFQLFHSASSSPSGCSR